MIKNIAMLFPGQGPQYPGMGKVFYERSAKVRSLYDQASEWLQYDLASHSFEGTADSLADTRYAQPAILLAGYAAYISYMEQNPGIGIPALMAGHSMGEITALLCAGAIEFQDAVALSVRRGELMNQVAAKKGGIMAAVKELPWQHTATICKQLNSTDAPVNIAAYNTPTQVVISGDAHKVEQVGEQCMAMDGIFVPLNITVASHSPLMEEIIAPFSKFIDGCNISNPATGVYSCLSGELYHTIEEVRHQLAYQLTAPVLWEDILKNMYRRGAGIFLEAGPGSALGKFVSNGQVLSLEKLTGEEIAAAIGNEYADIPTIVTRCLAWMLSIPNRNPDLTAHDTIFLPAYRAVQELQVNLEKERRLPAPDEIEQTIVQLVAACHARHAAKPIVRHLHTTLQHTFPYAASLFNTLVLTQSVTL